MKKQRYNSKNCGQFQWEFFARKPSLRACGGMVCRCQIRQHSPRTIELRQTLFDRLKWFVDDRSYSECGKSELREFLAYLPTGHQHSQGRWRYFLLKKAPRPETGATYFSHIRAFFSWLVTEELIAESQMSKPAPPVDDWL